LAAHRALNAAALHRKFRFHLSAKASRQFRLRLLHGQASDLGDTARQLLLERGTLLREPALIASHNGDALVELAGVLLVRAVVCRGVLLALRDALFTALRFSEPGASVLAKIFDFPLRGFADRLRLATGEEDQQKGDK